MLKKNWQMIILQKYNVSSSSYYRIVKTSEHDRDQLSKTDPRLCKKKIEIKRSKLESHVLGFVRQCNSMSFPASGNLIKTVAIKYANLKSIYDFSRTIPEIISGSAFQ
jgi:hypothetical protein